MSDLKKYNPPPGSADLYMAASKHFQQAKLILENVPSPDPEVRKFNDCRVMLSKATYFVFYVVRFTFAKELRVPRFLSTNLVVVKIYS